MSDGAYPTVQGAGRFELPNVYRIVLFGAAMYFLVNKHKTIREEQGDKRRALPTAALREERGGSRGSEATTKY